MNIQAVQLLSGRYENAWRNFEEAHNQYLSSLNPMDSMFDEVVEQFSKFNKEKVGVSQRIAAYVQENLRLNPEALSLYAGSSSTIMEDNIKHGSSMYAESVASCPSRTSRVLTASSRLSQQKRAEAARANLTLRLAEDERRRIIDSEQTILETDKKQKELEREYALDVAELECAKRMEILKHKTDKKTC